jgi:hypothetical protein
MLVQINVNAVGYTQYQVGHYGRFNITLLGITYVDSTNTPGIIQFESQQLYNSVGTPYLLISNVPYERSPYCMAPPKSSFTWTDKQIAGYIDFKLNNLTSGAAASGLIACLVDLDFQPVSDCC